ncbi:hypothetical protein GNY06_03245 [Elizabethkingia argentiflava]|uniref:Uncharacterized protein n=1 Tax=Elizabethkingia argenteiflava TaxID=2681556 RepID=A0A845PQI0_9FLAO|nr:hypothetical protein [Elizabethkingia argenteiflava]NAW50442.1 hypothetical protein [Elizabethkingia argenteiflava]
MESIANRNNPFKAIVEQLPERRKFVFKMIQGNPGISSQDLSGMTLLPINEILPRVRELRDIFLVAEDGSKVNKFTNKNNTIYRTLNSVEERIDLINAEFVRLRDSKSKLESDYHLGLTLFTKEIVKKEIDKIKSKITSLEKILDVIQAA